MKNGLSQIRVKTEVRDKVKIDAAKAKQPMQQYAESKLLQPNRKGK